jgi:hypothetical protein
MSDIYFRDLKPTIQLEVLKMIREKRPDMATEMDENPDPGDLVVGELYDPDNFEFIG